MTSISALILVDDRDGIRFAGLDLVERAALTMRKAGIERVHIVGRHLPDGNIVDRLRRRGLTVTCAERGSEPFRTAPLTDVVVVLPASTIVEPKAVTALLRQASLAPGTATLAMDTRPDAGNRLALVAGGMVYGLLAKGNAASTDLVVLSQDAVSQIRSAPSLIHALQHLAGKGNLRAGSVARYFCERVRDQRDADAFERAYLRHTNGGSAEGPFTRIIRRFSIPLSHQLLRFPITANQVTLIGFALSLAAGWAFSGGTYVAGLVGALFYYASMIFDCSDGEVARAKLGDSRFGAWLETVTDYLSYFVVLGGIVWGDVAHEGFCLHVQGAVVAATASLAIVLIVGYLRALVASANPGGFDDALAAQFRRGTGVQRFTGWSRQLIKRSFLAHLIVFQAVIGFLPVLLQIWACGSLAALILVLATHTHVVTSVRVEPLPAR
jgi:archaetidylinositol phosphate synthase